MEPRLTKVCTDHGIHKDVTDWLLTAAVHNMDDLATFIEKRDQVQAEILDNVPSQEDERAQRNKLKQVWHIAADEHEAKSERQ